MVDCDGDLFCAGVRFGTRSCGVWATRTRRWFWVPGRWRRLESSRWPVASRVLPDVVEAWFERGVAASSTRRGRHSQTEELYLSGCPDVGRLRAARGGASAATPVVSSWTGTGADACRAFQACCGRWTAPRTTVRGRRDGGRGIRSSRRQPHVGLRVPRPARFEAFHRHNCDTRARVAHKLCAVRSFRSRLAECLVERCPGKRFPASVRAAGQGPVGVEPATLPDPERETGATRAGSGTTSFC